MLSLLSAILKIVFIVFFFGFCVFIHEFGHMVVALWRGLHVEKFSIGMGPRLCGFRWRNIDFIISWLPFGGYVSLPQLDPTDNPKTSDGRDLPPATPGARALAAFAGPAFNILFGFLLATIMWAAGLWTPAPASSVMVTYVPEKLMGADGTEGDKPNPEWQAGLRAGDRIVAVNHKPFTGGTDEFQKEYVYSNQAEITLDVLRDGEAVSFTYAVLPNPLREDLGFPFFEYANPLQLREALPGPLKEAGAKNGDLLLSCNKRNIVGANQLNEILKEFSGTALGFTVERQGKELMLSPFTLPVGNAGENLLTALGASFGASVAWVYEDTPAKAAGLQTGDVFTAVEVLDAATGDVVRSMPVHDMKDFQQVVRGSDGAPLRFAFKRRGREMTAIATPRLNKEAEPPVWQIGIVLADGLDKVLAHPSPWSQFANVMGTTARTLGLLFSPLVGRVKSAVTGTPREAPNASIGLRHMSGPGGILMMLWYKLKDEGYRGGFAFIILITFSLAFMNLLPLPVLDGGHILFAGIEAVTHKRLPAKVLTWIYNIFAGLLIFLMLYITFFDGKRAWRLFHKDTPAAEKAAEQAQELQEAPETPSSP